MDNGLPGVGHVCDDTIGQDEQDEVLLQRVGCRAMMGISGGGWGWGRGTRTIPVTHLVASAHSDYSNSDNRLFPSACADSPKDLR